MFIIVYNYNRHNKALLSLLLHRAYRRII